VIPNNKITLSNIQIRKKENKFKELLYKIKILKPKYNELKGFNECYICNKDLTLEDVEELYNTFGIATILKNGKPIHMED